MSYDQYSSAAYDDYEDDVYSFNNQNGYPDDGNDLLNGILEKYKSNTIIASSGNMYYEDETGYGGNQFIPPQTGSMRLGTSSNPWNSQGFYAAQDGGMNRPMTSVKAVGFSSKSNLSESFGAKTQIQPLQKKSENSVEDMAHDMEKTVNRLIEESAVMCVNKEYDNALDKAKEAEKKEKQLVRFREEKNISGEQNFDLTYSVLFNLARCYHANGLYTEALETYQNVVKNKNYTHAGRLRVNMGNIYFEQRVYKTAIRMYRMALDQIMPAHHKELRSKISKNIGIAFIKLGQYNEAIQYFEEVVNNNNNDIDTAFNLLLCYYGMGDKKEMKKSFNKLLQVQIPGTRPEEDLDDEAHSLLHDDLHEFLKDQQRKHCDYILKAARLISEVVDEDWERGFDYIIDQLKSFALKKGGKTNIVGEVEMAKALTYMKHKKFSAAIEALKEFERKDKKLQTRAATNLTYLYLLEGDLKNAQKHANLAVETDKYNASALVNKGCVHYILKEYDAAKESFQQALLNESDCIQAIYNLGLVNKATNQYAEALSNFKKLHSIVSESIEVIYQIASTYSKMGETASAITWYDTLTHTVPTDPGALFDLGSLHTKNGEENNSFNAYLESYRYYPINMDVVSWLGLYFVKNEIYEKALQYFERATQIQPNEVNWQLMVASCHRRIGAFQQAKKCYEQIHAKYPENVEGLRYLAQICGELGLKKEKKQYSAQLKEIEKRTQRKEEEEEVRPVPHEEDMLTKQQQAEQRRLEEQRELQRQHELQQKQESYHDSYEINEKRVEPEEDTNIDDTNYIDDLY